MHLLILYAILYETIAHNLLAYVLYCNAALIYSSML